MRIEIIIIFALLLQGFNNIRSKSHIYTYFIL
nr:MAG TPA: hypothetical protein [Caudoviricetes sp.]